MIYSYCTGLGLCTPLTPPHLGAVSSVAGKRRLEVFASILDYQQFSLVFEPYSVGVLNYV